MAQLLLISNKTYREGLNEIGDIVGRFNDTHVFSSTEQEVFEIMQIKGVTEEELDERLSALRPEKESAWKSETTEWCFDQPEEKELWKNAKDEWCYLEEEEKYPFTCAGMKDSIKAALADSETDKVAKLILVDTNIKETISRRVENLNKVDKLSEGGELIQGK